MNRYQGRTQQFIQSGIRLRVWAVIALAMGVYIALLVFLASVDI
jgi:hypothetical protein